MKVVMPILGILVWLLSTTFSDAMTIQEKLCEHWADEKDKFLEYSRKAREDTIKLLPYVLENGRLRAVFYGDKNTVTTFFDDGLTCDMHVVALYNVLFNEKPQKFLRDGKIYNAQGDLVEDVSIGSNEETSSTKSKKRKNYIPKFTRYWITKFTNRFDT